MDLASGVAGLLGLAGLTVQCATKLYVYCRKIPRVAGEVKAIIDEVQRLSEAIEAIQQVASDRELQQPSARTADLIEKLRAQFARCTADLEAWNASMTALQIEDGKWAKNAVKRLKLAADSGRFSETKSQISSHRGQLLLLVELLTADLQFATSLNIQSMDSKVDKFTESQNTSQHVTNSHLEQIKASMDAAVVVQSASLAETTEISNSTIEIQETLHEMHQSTQSTRMQVEKLDATLVAIAQSLLKSTIKGSRSTRTGTSFRKRGSRRCNTVDSGKDQRETMTDIFSEFVQQTTEVPIVQAQINKLVDLAVIVRYRCGKAHFEPVAVPDSHFEAANIETKLRMVKHLQDLRLLLWLLCQKEKEYIYSKGTSEDQASRRKQLSFMTQRICWRHSYKNYEPTFFPERLYCLWNRAYTERMGFKYVIGSHYTVFVEVSTAAAFKPIRLPAGIFAPTTDEKQVTQLGWGGFTMPVVILGLSLCYLKRICELHVEEMFSSPQYSSIITAGDSIGISKQILDVMSKYICANKSVALLQNVMKIHAIQYFLACLPVFTEKSAREIYEKVAPQTTRKDYRNLASRLLTRQIKSAMHELHREITFKVFEDLEDSIRSRKTDCWGSSFCTILMLCLFIERVQISHYVMVVLDLRKGDTTTFDQRDRSQILNACGELEQYPFLRSIELFHDVYRSHKDGREPERGEQNFNPLQMADNDKCEMGLDMSTKTMVKSIHSILRQFWPEIVMLSQIASTPDLEYYAKHPTDMIERNRGRLAARFLRSFFPDRSQIPWTRMAES